MVGKTKFTFKKGILDENEHTDIMKLSYIQIKSRLSTDNRTKAFTVKTLLLQSSTVHFKDFNCPQVDNANKLSRKSYPTRLVYLKCL